MFRRRLVSIVFFTLIGAILFGSAGPLDLPAFRACWAGCVFSAVAPPLLTRPTVLEDTRLRTGLAGYSEYAARVRWRLVPELG